MNKGYLGFHLVMATGKAYNGYETPFKVLETRTINPNRVMMCNYGYHWTKLPSDCIIGYNYGPMIEFCLFSPPIDKQDKKYLSSSKMVIATADISILRDKLLSDFYGDHFKSNTLKKFNIDVYKALGLKFGRGE